VRRDAKTGCKKIKKWFSDVFGVGRSDGVSGDLGELIQFVFGYGFFEVHISNSFFC
jgi:hypothetical protein